MRGWVHLLLFLLLGAGLVAPAAEPIERADPLEVPAGPGWTPEMLAHLDVRARINRAEKSLRDRGYGEMPVLALALLERAAERPGDPAMPLLAARALTLAPGTPAVHFAAARLLGKPTELAQAARTLFTSAPAVLWLLELGGSAIGMAGLATAIVLLGVAFARGAPLHAHRFGHLGTSSEPPIWPGVLLEIALVAALPLLGLGPVAVAAAAGLLALACLRLPEAAPALLALLLLGVLLGPGLDRWARIAALPDADPALFAAWRVDHAQPLPQDRQSLWSAIERSPGDLLLRVAMATAWEREGELDRAREVLAGLRGRSSPVLRARAANLMGVLELAEGDVEPSIRAFEQASSLERSAAVLYNLAQAHGRGLRLIRQSTYFKQARALDPELIGRYTKERSSSIHDYLIHLPIPLREYLRRGLEPSPQAAAIAGGIRRWTLGRQVPEWAWMLLPVLAFLALIPRSTRVDRCARCERPVCPRCAPGARSRLHCSQCARLFVRGERSDPRVRRREIERDRQRQRRRARWMACLALLVPGLAAICEGRLLGGTLRVFALALAAAILLPVLGSPLLPGPVLLPPADVGALARPLELGLGLVLLTPLYLWAAIESGSRLAEGYRG